MGKTTESKYPLDWSGGFGLTDQIKGFSLDVDKEGVVKALIVIPATSSASAGLTANYMNVTITDPVANSQARAYGNAGASGLFDVTVGLVTDARQMVYNPATGYDEMIRTPTIYKSLTASAIGNTALWTPVAGKKFRLLGGLFSCDSGATGPSIFSLQDAAVAIGIRIGSISAAVPAGVTWQLDIRPNGYLSSAINNVLNVNLTGALGAGQLNCSVWGTEE